MAKDKKGSPKEVSGTSEFGLSQSQLLTIKSAYEDALSRNQALLDEVVFILNERIAAGGIKIHLIEHRIKELPSVIRKCREKNLSDMNELVDVVGARVVSLFRSDLARIGEIIAANFDVVHVDDKVSKDTGALGYMSVHYVCKMPVRYKGPRYENTLGIQFEIQVRTLCMHAWAAASHYLDYKGDWDVPLELKRSLSALSGLFYVADTEFEQFYAARLGSKKDAEQSPPKLSESEINLDTVTAYLRRKFPDREHADEDDSYSIFVRELKGAGFRSLAQVDREIDRAYEAFTKYEEENPPSRSPKFADVGAARLSLGLASEKFYSRLKEHRQAQPDELLEFRQYLSGPDDPTRP